MNETDLNFENQINQLFEKINKEEIDYFSLLGLSRTAILKDIESSYRQLSQEFSEQKIMGLTDPELKRKASLIAKRINRAYEILSDYDKRADYEKRGYRELSPDDIPDEDPLEIAKTLYRKAKTLYNRQDFAMAISALEQAIRLDPEKPDHYYLLGVCQSKIPSLIKQAEQNLLKAAEIEPWNAEHFAALGMLFYSEKFFNKAETYFRKALAQEPSHALAKKKLEEIVGPEKKPLDSVKENLQKIFPTFFGKKNK